ncbi:MAG: hypothetical protein IJE02_04840 [Clostridia bacterium]|nr:hypothetical protein [Clostridia bacterium]
MCSSYKRHHRSLRCNHYACSSCIWFWYQKSLFKII